MSQTKTLKQIRYEKKEKVGIPLTDKEQDECYREWLEQKRREIVVDSDLRCVIYADVKAQAKLLDELLGELKE